MHSLHRILYRAEGPGGLAHLTSVHLHIFHLPLARRLFRILSFAHWVLLVGLPLQATAASKLFNSIAKAIGTLEKLTFFLINFIISFVKVVKVIKPVKILTALQATAASTEHSRELLEVETARLKEQHATELANLREKHALDCQGLRQKLEAELSLIKQEQGMHGSTEVGG